MPAAARPVSGAAERGMGRARARSRRGHGTTAPQIHRRRRSQTRNRTLGERRAQASGAAIYQRSLAARRSRRARMASIWARKTSRRPISTPSRRPACGSASRRTAITQCCAHCISGRAILALGAVFPTTTKVMPTAPQGIARLARYVRLLDGRVPLVAIGGVNGDVLPRRAGNRRRQRRSRARGDRGSRTSRAAVSALQHEFPRDNC